MSIQLLSYGEMLLENGGRGPVPGGSPFRLAAHASRLGQSATMYSRIGTDSEGNRLNEAAKKYGVDISIVHTDNSCPTGTATFDPGIRKQGICEYKLADKCAARFISPAMESVDTVAHKNFNVLCFQTLSQMFSQSRDTLFHILQKVNACEIFYDINLRGDYYSRKIILSLLPHATIVRCNSDEKKIVSTIVFGKIMETHEFTQRISKEYAIPLICVRQKAKGYSVYHAGIFVEIESYSQNNQNPGCGDAFNAAFLSLFCAGHSPFESAKIGAKIENIAGADPQQIPAYEKNILTQLS